MARAILEQEETLLTGRWGAPPLVLPADFARLQQLLRSYMPEATGFGIPIDHNRLDNICKGTATDDGLPQVIYLILTTSRMECTLCVSWDAGLNVMFE